MIIQLRQEISENEAKIKLKDAELDKLKTERKQLISRLSESRLESSSSLVSCLLSMLLFYMHCTLYYISLIQVSINKLLLGKSFRVEVLNDLLLPPLIGETHSQIL